MTDSNDKRTSKLLIYKKLFTLNRAFVHAERNLNSLLAAEVLTEELTRAWQNRLKEIQAEINKQLTSTLRDQEHKDARLGQMNEQQEDAQRKK